MNAKNTKEKHIYIFTNIINKIEAEAGNFEKLEFDRQTALVDDLLLAINFGFLEHEGPLFKLAIRRLKKLLDVYSLDLEQYNALKKIILRALATDVFTELKIFLKCYNLKGLKNINEKIIISDIEIITCLLIKQGLQLEALLASKILIEYTRDFIERKTDKRDEIINGFFQVETFILSMAARTNNKSVFMKNLENINLLLEKIKIVNTETKKSFQNFIISILFFSADKNWVGALKNIEAIINKVSWKNKSFSELSHEIIYEWVQIISMLILRKWYDIQQEFLLGLVKFSVRCNKENKDFSNLMISKLLLMQISKDGMKKSLVCFETWFVFISLNFDFIVKRQVKNSKKEMICSSNKYVDLLYNFFVFVEKVDLKDDNTEVLKLWYGFWSDVKVKKSVYYRIDALTRIAINYWLILNDNSMEKHLQKKAYIKKILDSNSYEDKYQYLIYDRSNVKL